MSLFILRLQYDSVEYLCMKCDADEKQQSNEDKVCSMYRKCCCCIEFREFLYRRKGLTCAIHDG
jgi:hypothetical protein